MIVQHTTEATVTALHILGLTVNLATSREFATMFMVNDTAERASEAPGSGAAFPWRRYQFCVRAGMSRS